MYTYIKAQVALIAGSLSDFLLTFLLVTVFNCWYVPANVLGNIAGAGTQFIISRSCVFTASKKAMSVQVIKFIIMWAGNILLSATGVYLLTQYFAIHFFVSKLIISIVLGTTYMYVLSKWFVFE